MPLSVLCPGYLDYLNGVPFGDWRRSEDLLVVELLLALRYLPPEQGAWVLFKNARTLEGKALKEQYADSTFDQVEIVREPELPTGIPDALLVFSSEQRHQRLGVLVEAKLYSPQHEKNGKSQLGVYGCEFFRAQHIGRHGLGAERALVS